MSHSKEQRKNVGEQFENGKRLSNLDSPNTYLLLGRTDFFLSLHFAELIKLHFLGIL